MLEPQPRPGPLAEPEKPVVMIPMTAEDAERLQRRRNFTRTAVGMAVVILGWYVYVRMVNPVRAQQAYTDGVRLIQATRYEQAILNFDRAIELKPDFADAYRMRGRAYVAVGKPDEAIPDFTKVAVLRPADATVLVDRGFAYLDKKDWAKARADASRALEMNGKLARAYNLRATAVRATGGVAEALEDYSRAVELDPNLDNYFQRAATYQLLNEHQRAVADFDQALALAPDQPHTYYARAQSRAAIGDAKGAQEDIRAGRKIDGW
ncbi:MAG TPA: tetratricopeptide repeat protein [Bryobacteraceae bacterium]|nr:tetratricopeptide repeat protein [Bryobacteraceae bacterium]